VELADMDFLALFRGSPEKQIQRLRKKVKEPHGDPSVRQGAAQKLFEMGTPEALRALLDRFTISVSPSVQDELEREQVFSWLVQLGETAVPPLLDFLRRERAVHWPAKTLQAILPPDRQAREFNDLLRFLWDHPPANAIPKTQLIRSLGDLWSEELDRTVRLFLEDDDDDVRLAAVDYLMSRSEEAGRDDVIRCYLESADRPRIRSQILEFFLEKGWSCRGHRSAVEESLPEGFSLTREGKLRRIGS
jgi:HEAT repeat protein